MQVIVLQHTQSLKVYLLNKTYPRQRRQKLEVAYNDTVVLIDKQLDVKVQLSSTNRSCETSSLHKIQSENWKLVNHEIQVKVTLQHHVLRSISFLELTEPKKLH